MWVAGPFLFEALGRFAGGSAAPETGMRVDV